MEATMIRRLLAGGTGLEDGIAGSVPSEPNPPPFVLAPSRSGNTSFVRMATEFPRRFERKGAVVALP